MAESTFFFLDLFIGAVGVSDASATNYLSELESEGKIEQVGERGRFVSYRLNKK